jgi:hypothetical protein
MARLSMPRQRIDIIGNFSTGQMSLRGALCRSNLLLCGNFLQKGDCHAAERPAQSEAKGALAARNDIVREILSGSKIGNKKLETDSADEP